VDHKGGGYLSQGSRMLKILFIFLFLMALAGSGCIFGDDDENEEEEKERAEQQIITDNETAIEKAAADLGNLVAANADAQKIATARERLEYLRTCVARLSGAAVVCSAAHISGSVG